MKKILRKIIPEWLVLKYHWLVAFFAAFYYRFPSKRMIVIGVTGTKGKTSTVNFIWSALNFSGKKTGIISTTSIKIGKKNILNDYHMTMPGRFTISRFMAQMAKEGCEVCIVETTSEGIKQHRHTGIFYDILVFTNLTPEHLPSHSGSFEKYKETKGLIFKKLSSFRKKINRKETEKIIIANKDSEHADYFLGFPADKRVGFAIKNDADYVARNIRESGKGVDFEVRNENFKIDIPGVFNVYNVFPAIIISQIMGVSLNSVKKGILKLKKIPGRMEEIKAGQEFKVFVDYAHEKESITEVLKTANNIKKEGKVIILLGAEGGGRDKAKRPAMGEISAKMADSVIVSNVDPYEDDPKEIIEDIVKVAEENGKIREENLFSIEDRRKGIKKALEIADKGDVVLITGKGAEQSITIDGKASPWDDRVVVKEEIVKIKK